MRNWFVNKVLMLVLMLIVVSVTKGCARMTVSSGAIDRAYCASFQPMWWSDKDTDESIEQAKAHNAVGVKLCGWRG